MYLYSLAKSSSPSIVRAPQLTMPFGKIRMVFIALGFKVPFSPSENLCLSPTTPRRSASVPAGAFQTPRVLSIRAHNPAIAPEAPMFFLRPFSSIVICGKNSALKSLTRPTRSAFTPVDAICASVHESGGSMRRKARRFLQRMLAVG